MNDALAHISHLKSRTFLSRHSREGGNPGLVGFWTPAFAGDDPTAESRLKNTQRQPAGIEADSRAVLR